MRMSGLIFVTCVALTISVFAGPLETLTPGQWYEIPNSRMRDVCPGLTDGVWNYYCAANISAWSGGAFDTKRNRLIIWGGGHADSPDNSVYVFDLNILKWERIWGPSTDFGGDPKTCLYPDGNPRSVHSYNYLQYIPSIDKFCSFGMASCYPDGNAGSSKTFMFDFETKKWDVLASVPVETGINAISGYDPVTDRAFLHCVSSNSRLGVFDPVKNTWSSGQVNPWGGLYPSGTADVDVVNRKLVLIGNDVKAWNVDNPTAEPQVIPTTGETSGLGPYNGAAYHPLSRKIFVWKSGKTVYTLDVATRKWEKYEGKGDDPGSPASNGTFGRFRYSPKSDVFVLVNNSEKNVFVYKPHTGSTVIRNSRKKIAGNTDGKTRIFDSCGKSVAKMTGFPQRNTRIPAGIYIVQTETDGTMINRVINIIR